MWLYTSCKPHKKRVCAQIICSYHKICSHSVLLVHCIYASWSASVVRTSKGHFTVTSDQLPVTSILDPLLWLLKPELSCKMYPVVTSASYGRTYLANLTSCKGSFKSDKQLINTSLIIASLGFFADFAQVSFTFSVNTYITLFYYAT